MLPKNIINPEKKDKVEGTVFHLFYPDIHTSILFDKDLSVPIIYGNKNIVMTWIKKLDELIHVTEDTKIRIYSYILDGQSGYRRIDTYNGPISQVGKYIRRY